MTAGKIERIGNLARGVGDRVGAGCFRLGALRGDDVAVERVAFDFFGDAVHRRDRFAPEIVRPPNSADSITASAPSKIAVATSETSARVGTGAADHRFQHLRRHDHRLAGDAAGARHLLLHAGHFLQRHLHAEIAARHHQRVGEVDDFGEPVHRLRLLDLGHHRRAPARDLLGLGDVFRPLDE